MIETENDTTDTIYIPESNRYNLEILKEKTKSWLYSKSPLDLSWQYMKSQLNRS